MVCIVAIMMWKLRYVLATFDTSKEGFKSNNVFDILPVSVRCSSSRDGVRYRRWYLGTGTGTWELARYRYRYRYRYMIFQKYLGTGTGTHEKYLGTGTGTLYDGVTKNQTCFQTLIPGVYLSSYIHDIYIYILKFPANQNARKWHSLSLCKALYSYVHLYIYSNQCINSSEDNFIRYLVHQSQIVIAYCFPNSCRTWIKFIKLHHVHGWA